MRRARVPLVVVEDDVVQDAVTTELLGAGWTVGSVDEGVPDPTGVVVVVVATEVDARSALLLAMRGRGLLVRARADRAVVDDLVEDLAHLGPVLLADRTRTISLDVDTWRLMHALADGRTVSAAARDLHMSLRTANRRIGDAKTAMGVPTRGLLLRALGAPDRISAPRSTRESQRGDPGFR